MVDKPFSGAAACSGLGLACDREDPGSVPRWSCCCCFLEQELYPHCSSLPSCIIGECETTLVVVFPSARNFTHINL